MKINRILKKMALLFIVLLCMGIIGCDNNAFEGISNDDSFQAKLEKARMKIDDESYSDAITLLENMLRDYPKNTDVLKYLSDAYAGLSGLDTLNLLEVIDELDDANESGTIDMIGLVLGDADGTITSSQLDEKLDYLEEAIAKMSEIVNPDEDQIIQLGVLSITHLALSIAKVVLNDQTGLSEITLTEEGIDNIYSTPADIDTTDAPASLLSEMAEDIERISDAVDALDQKTGSDNDLSEDFNEFSQDIDPDGNDVITVQELEDYLNGLIT